jgi:glycosyltransferase involved in cell wall biosynthesis
VGEAFGQVYLEAMAAGLPVVATRTGGPPSFVNLDPGRPDGRSLDPTGRGRARWATRWKPALNAFSITFEDRFPAAETY